MLHKILIIIDLSFIFLAGPAFACPDDEKRAQTSDSRSVLYADAEDAWDEVEDGVTGEGPEERAEEAEERCEDRLEEIEEERAKGN